MALVRAASHTKLQGRSGGGLGGNPTGKGLGDRGVSLPSLFPNAGALRGTGYPAPVGSELRSSAVKRTPSELLAERREFGMVVGRDHKPQITSFLDLAQYSNYATSAVPVDQPLFSVSPPVVAFSNFEGLQVYEAVVTLRNQDNVSRRVKVFPPDSPFFELAPSRGRGGRSGAAAGGAPGDKVPPGMEVSYVVRFKPDARIDYAYDLVVVTEREKFSVPIRASGGSALLDFPDLIDFGDECIVGDRSERTILVRNIGDRSTKFVLRAAPPFSVVHPDGYLAEGQACQVSVFFTPERAKAYECDIYLKYGELEAVGLLRGGAQNADVSLTLSMLMIEDTYVGLETQGVVTIRNDSDVPVDFSWRLFPSVDEEMAYRAALQTQLRQEEADETLYVQQAQGSEDSSDDSNSDGERLRLRREAKISNGLGRKYGNIAKAVKEDPMLFRDSIFAIEPLTGRVWANSQMTCTCSFSPKDALVYSCSAYLSCVGQEERAPLVLKGLGIGPKATFSYDELDVGNVFVESAHRYEVQLLNQGDIEVEFKLMPRDTKFGSKFGFRPSSGVVAVGGQCEIVVDFKPSELGAFHEVFDWTLKGSATAVTLAFRGISVQPTFTFDAAMINFGNVSFGFLNSRMLTLTNTSQVPCVYNLRIPGDDQPPNNEFDIIPSRGTLLPSCAQRIQVDFVSTSEKKYDVRLAVDLEGVGNELLSIPIYAQCSVPSVSFEPHGTLTYGDIFIRYPFHQSLYLHNTSPLPAKFEVMPQEDKSRAEFQPDQWTGSVPPCASHVITVTLTAHTPGQLRIPMYVKVHGRSVPFPLVLLANSVGPRVEVDPPTLDWGQVKCLEPVTRHVKLTNSSCIDASVRAFMNERKSVWNVHPKIIHLSPQETLQLAITLKIDETTTMQDTLNLIVQEGEDLAVQVKGRGIETPVTCEPNTELVDFGTQFTTHTEAREIVVRNFGQASRRITWAREKDKDKKNKKDDPAERMASKRSRRAQDDKLLQPIFRVEPEFVVMEPKSAYRFTLLAMSPVPGEVEDVLVCTEALDKGGGVGKIIFKPKLKANFVAPQLRLSTTEMNFLFLWAKDRPVAPLTEALSLHNTGPLEVRFKVEVQYPFSVDIDEGLIPSNGIQEILVDFDPGFKADRKSCVVKQKLKIQYDEHPSVNTVELVGKVVWPNLELEPTKVDFGTVINETTRRMEVRMSNPTAVPVAYHWCFSLPGRTADEFSNPRTPAMLTPHESKTSGFLRPNLLLDDGDSQHGTRFAPGLTDPPAEQIDVSQIFDILPIYGRLEPGESQLTQFSYYGMHDRAFKASAVCMVEGGPEYTVELKGNAAPCKYTMDKSELNFGDIPFTEIAEQELFLSNPGKVPITFNFNLSGISRQVLIDISPSVGSLKPEERQKINVKFRAGIPDQVCETVLVEVEYYEPRKLVVRGKGTFPGIVLSLPRLDEETHRLALQAAALRVQQARVDEDPDLPALPSSGSADGVAAAAAATVRRAELTAGPGAAGGAVGSDAMARSGVGFRGGSAADVSSSASAVEAGELEPVAAAAAAAAAAASAAASRRANANNWAVDDQAARQLELELEVDRYYLCEVLLRSTSTTRPPGTATATAAFGATARLPPGMPSMVSPSRGARTAKKASDSLDVVGAHYVCDFGYIALGQTAKKRIDVHNCCTEMVSIPIDKRVLRDNGFLIDPDSLRPLPPGKSTSVNITATRAKDGPEGVSELAWDLPVRGGPLYKVFLKAEFVLPDLTMTHKVVDFGRILVGQRKRVNVEFRNEKMVPVEWSYQEPKDKYGKAPPPHEIIFNMVPSSGLLMPGERKLVVISFSPRAAQQYSGMLQVKLRDNQKRKQLQVLGRGDTLQLEVRPSATYELGPIMPNMDGASREFILYNPTDYWMEVYSVEFDSKYREEERLLVEYDGYVNGIAELPVRNVGDGTWRKVVSRVSRIRRRRAAEEAKAAGEDGAAEALAALNDEEAAGEAGDDAEGDYGGQEAAPPSSAKDDTKRGPKGLAPQGDSKKKPSPVARSPTKGRAEEALPPAEQEPSAEGAGQAGDVVPGDGQAEAGKEVQPIDLLPPASVVQLLPVPALRPERTPPANFRILTPQPHSSEDGGENDPPAPEITTSDQARWIIEPQSEQRLLVHFNAGEVASFSTTLGFEIVGDANGVTLPISVSGVAALPGIQSEPRLVFPRCKRKRPAEGHAVKAFITSIGVYDFGPLLAGRSPAARLPPQTVEDQHAHHHSKGSRVSLPHSEDVDPGDDDGDDKRERFVVSAFVMRHAENIRMTNDSLFPAHVTLGLASAEGEGGGGPSPFLLEPSILHLAVGEQADVKVWCFPTDRGVFQDRMIARIEHNPEPVSFGLCAVGEVPTATLDVDQVDFGRLMMNIRAEDKRVRLKNPSALPVKWQLHSQHVQVTDGEGVPVKGHHDSSQGLPEEFSVEPMEGTLAAGEERDVRIGFRAAQPATFSFSLHLNVRDAEGLRDWQEAGKVAVQAETFAVDAVVEPDPHDHALDFGTVLVHSSSTCTFDIVNRGRFTIRYQLAVRRALRDFISIDRPKDEIPKGERRTITVTCTPTKVVEVPSERDGLALQVFDTLSGESVDHKIPQLRIGVNAVYNSFQVTPPRGLNFGPVEKGEKLKRTFAVRNVGIFPFNWCLFDYANPPPFAEDGKPSQMPASVKAGPFTVNKATGHLQPDEEKEVEVIFEATGDQDYDSKIAIWVGGVQGDEATASHLPGTSAYLLTGQSCVPGINTTDLQAIFEEQFFAHTLEDAIAIVGRPDVRVFCETDKVFNFGPVLAHSSSKGGSVPASPTAAGAGGHTMGGGVTECLRLTNLKAVPCEVHLAVKPRDDGGKAELPFEVSPSKVVIAPLDSQQISVSFRPFHLGSFGAMLEATVPKGSDPNTNYLAFELRGDGAVPSVSLQGPRLFGDKGGELQMGKLPVGRSHEVRMALRNDGLLPATVRVEIKRPSVHFTLSCPPSVSLGRGEQRTFQVRFHPRAEGPAAADLSVRTLGNEAFEDVTIQLLGEGYSDTISWDLTDVRCTGAVVLSTAAARGLGDDLSLEALPPSPDELDMGQVTIGGEARATFKLSNSSPHALRFEFPEDMPPQFARQLTVEPRSGFVQPGAPKPITFVLRPLDKLEALKVPVACKLTSVVLARGDSPEPQFTVLDGTARELPLRVSAVADSGVVCCTVKEICFAPTVMFSSKVYRFTVTNPSKIAAPFEWKVVGKTAAAFSITPPSGAVPAEGEQEMEVRFQPIEVEDFGCELLCIQPGVAAAAGKAPVKILLGGSALRPWCHIELVEGDYRSRRQADTPLDPKYRVVEIVSLGTGVKNTKRFYVHNPTGEAIDFAWVLERHPNNASQDDFTDEDTFRCLAKRGTILPGKKFEMSFEFAPQSMETKECFWNFCLLGQKVVEYFLVVGKVEEPRVGMDQKFIQFGEKLLESSATEKVHLVNKEHIPFGFSIDLASFQLEGQQEAVSVSPVTGVIGPDSSVDLEVTFKPMQERSFNFNIICNIKRKKEPVVLNVKGSGYKIHASLAVEEPAGRRFIYPGTMESLDFGILQVQERRTIKLYLGNQSKKNFNFVVQVQQGHRPPKPLTAFEKPPFLAITQGSGDVFVKDEVLLELTYAPRDVHTLEGSVLQVVIPAGPAENIFQIALGGGAKKPRVDFSFVSHDFGPCFIAKDGATMAGEPFSPAESHRYERVDLIATNRDDMDCIIATTFQREPWLDVQLNASMIEAGGQMRIPIVFSPREVCEYMQRVEFVLNDYTRAQVDIRGRGCPLRLELTDLEMQHVNFGVVTGGETVHRTVRLVNRSPRAVTFRLEDEKEELVRRGVFWSPSGPTLLRPRETCDVDLRFAPTTRVAPFKLPLLARCDGGLDLKLLTMEGTCHATEMRLSEHSVFFGDVVVGSQATSTVRIHNFGDLGAKYRFEVPARYAKFFSISPAEGFVRPQEEISLTVAFHPTRERVLEYKKGERAMAMRRGKAVPSEAPGPLNLRLNVKDIRCILDGIPPLTLETTGSCVERTGEARMLPFQTEVRKEEKKFIEVHNTQDVDWKLQPQVTTTDPAGANYFSCPREVLVPAKKTEKVEVVYLPFTMTGVQDAGGSSPVSPSSTKNTRCDKHKGTLFIGTPNGDAILYTLEGEALPPKVDKRLKERVPCKKQHNQRVPVKNWLHERQRFDVRVELADPDPKSPDPKVQESAQGISLNGVGTLDLPPGLERDYRFSVYAYHEGSALVRVCLTSQETGEFIVVEVELDFYAPESLATIRLEAPCRQVARHKIAVANPLSKEAKFTGTSTHPHIRIAHELTVPARSERTLELLFRPVEEGEGDAEVVLKSDELGTYPYTVQWRATPAGLERSLTFKAPLGASSVDFFKFVHMARSPVEYKARIEAAPGQKGPTSDFMLEESSVMASACDGNDLASKELQIRVRYRPSSLGTKEQPSVSAMLVITGVGGGEYKAMLTGFAQPPQPQGPFEIQSGGKPFGIEFQNPFEKPTEFTLQIDNPCFNVPMRSLTIDPQKTIPILVSYKSDKAQGGRLIISCKQVSAPWVFYLKGEV